MAANSADSKIKSKNKIKTAEIISAVLSCNNADIRITLYVYLL